jgi:hypothetical protein
MLMGTNYDTVKMLAVDIVGDANHIRRQQGIDKLVGYGAAEVVPVLIEVLLGKGRTIQFWDDVVEGISGLLQEAVPSFAQPCAPALVYLLATASDAQTPDPVFFLDILDTKVDIQELSCAIPALLDLVRLHHGNEVATTALQLLRKFSPE